MAVEKSSGATWFLSNEVLSGIFLGGKCTLHAFYTLLSALILPKE
jgi:hypothetical protein